MIQQDIQKTLETAFLNYAGYNIQRRAIPDARDGLKWGARQLLHAQMLGGFVYNKPFKKAVKSVAQAMGFSYVHGDASAYGTFIRMAKPFSYRYPLQLANGNYGTLINPDDHSASRYVELKGSEIASYLLKDLDKNTIDSWEETYDMEGKFPTVLPAKGFWNIVNGCISIGSGMACSIAPTNLTEVNNALIKLLKNPNIDDEEILCYPDFPTGATIINKTEIKNSLLNGNGKACKIRATIEYNEKEHCLTVVEMPYSTFTNTICQELANLIEADPECGITHFNDYTKIKPDLRIYLNKKANINKVLSILYKNTSLQTFYTINMTMLDKGKTPKIFGWREALQAHIDHEKIIYRKGFEYDLNKINYRIHIINGLLICLAKIEEVIQTIKTSNSTSDAKQKLQKEYLLDEEQAKAVLDMKLSRLANLEVQKLKDEKTSLEIEKNRIETILNNEELFNEQLINGWKEIIKKFGDERRTRVIDIADEVEESEIIAENCIVILTENNTIKRVPSNNYKPQNRNGKGIKNQEDITSMIIRTNTQDYLMIFTNQGNMYRLLVDDIPEGTNQSKGYPVDALITMQADEKAEVIYSIYRDTTAQYVLFVTKKGIVKKTSLEEYIKTKKKNGLTAINLKENDKIASAFLVKDEPIIILTKNGYGLKIKSTDVSASGRVTMGVKGINLGHDDEVVCALPIRDINDDLAVFAEDGTAKKFAIKDIPIQARGGKGLIYCKERAAAACLVSNGDQALVVGSKTSICVKAEDIPVGQRTTIGSIILKGNKVIGVSKI